MGNMRFKAGDRVRIKSLDWYNENKDEYGTININCDFIFYPDRSKYCGKVFTISEIFDNCYGVKEDNNEYYWTDEMIEGLVEEEEEVGLIDGFSSRWINEFNLPEGYIFKDENGNVINATKIVLEKKKKEYPKTYEECCKVFGLNHYLGIGWNSYDEYSGVINHLPKQIDDIAKKLESLSKLLVCRNAYWKLAGEEMGLGKPWEPDWHDNEKKYTIECYDGEIIREFSLHQIRTFSFPAYEMRDAFKENFKEMIEQCKELL